MENWRTVVGCTVVLSQARTAADPDAGKKRGGNEVEESSGRERGARWVDKGMEIEREAANRAETERRKEEKLLNAKWNGN